MKRITTLLAILMLSVTALFAQAPEKFTYQAVVRNASNSLVANAPVGVRVSILQGGVAGTLVFMENHTAVTNANGLVTIIIGAGNLQQGSMSDIQWAASTVFLKTEIDPAGGSNYTITSTQQLLSVPYALYANEAANGFSGDYNDLTNTPQIPQIPTNVSAFNNDAGYITMDSVPTNISAFTNDAGYLTGYTETDPVFNAWDKDYEDLINKPTIPTVPTNVSAFTNDAGYLTSFTEQQILTISNDTIFLTGGSFVKLPEGFDGDYNSLINQPVIPTVPTVVSAFSNDAGYITMDSVPTNISAFTNDEGYLTGYTETDPQFNAWDKDYNDLINTPAIPTVPTNVSAFTNDAGYITMDSVPTIPTTVSSFINDAGYLTDFTETDPQFNAWDKDYNDLINTPTIPTVPANVSAFTNDAGYLTSFTEQQILTISNDTIFLTGGSFVKLPEGFDGDYNSLTNTPQIPQIPTNVSAFNNDANYISNAGCTEVDLCSLAAALSELEALVQEQQRQIEALAAQIGGDPDTTITPNDTLTDGVSCPNVPTVTDYDGNVYNTVQIGNQCWMKENLRTTKFADGTDIQAGITVSSTNPYYYDFTASNIPLEARGYLYNWAAVMHGASSSETNPSGAQGICPDGWHVPSDAEWSDLEDYLGSQSQYLCSNNNTHFAKALAATTGWSTYSSNCAVGKNQNLNNTTGFSAIPGGYYYTDGYRASGDYAIFWSSTVASSGYVLNRTLSAPYAYMNRGSSGKIYGYSVRCLCDATGGISDSTQTALPTVTTDTISAITTTSATCGGNVISDGGAEVTGRGVCWSTMQNPTMEDNHTNDGSGTGTFSSSITGLSPNTTYYVRAYATNSEGTAYGNEIEFTTSQNVQPCIGAPTVTDYDGNVYSTVQIGDQCWMNENLRSLHYSNGDTILLGSGRRYPNNDESNVSEYGYLYHWYTTMHLNNSYDGQTLDTQGICPSGWHVPSYDEWGLLRAYASQNYDGNISLTGFSAKLAGKYWNGYYNFGDKNFFWTRDYVVNQAVAYRFINNAMNMSANHETENAYAYFSVRCLRNAGASESDSTQSTIPAGDAQPCPGTPTVTDHEGNVYNTVQIGTQCWLKENLRTTTSPSTGTYLIPEAGVTYTYSGKQARWYDNDSATYAPKNFGLLYNWNAAVDTFNTSYEETSVITSSNFTVNVTFSGNRRGICPQGWHIPSETEWTDLVTYVSSQPIYRSEYETYHDSTWIAKSLSSDTIWSINNSTCAVGNNIAVNNLTGFSAIPAGITQKSNYTSGSSIFEFRYKNNHAYFWSSTQNETNAKSKYIVYDAPDVKSNYSDQGSGKGMGMSVRCLRD